MMTLSLAVRNLLRNRRRSVSTLLALCIGSVAVLLFGGYSANIKYSMQTGYVRSGGHLQIQHKDFFLYGSGNPGAYGIAEHERVIQALLADPVLKPLVVVAHSCESRPPPPAEASGKIRASAVSACGRGPS